MQNLEISHNIYFAFHVKVLAIYNRGAFNHSHSAGGEASFTA